LTEVAIFQDPARRHEPSWSERFGEVLASEGIESFLFSRLDHATLDRLAAADGVMWRMTFGRASQGVAKPLLSTCEFGWGKAVWPSAATRWHYDDKAAQAWLLRILGDLVPRTHVFTSRDEALAWADTADYPQVFKLRGGSRSSGVCRVESPDAARRLIERAFLRGLNSAEDVTSVAAGKRASLAARLAMLPRRVLREAYHTLTFGRASDFQSRVPLRWPTEHGYVTFQEYLPGNRHDHKVIVIGDRARAYRRMIPAGDWRASGSEQRDFDHERIDVPAIQLAFEVSERFGFQCMGYDMLRDAQGRFRIVEISYTFAADIAFRCDGYWDRNLRWHPERSWPQDWIAQDFAAELRTRMETLSP